MVSIYWKDKVVFGGTGDTSCGPVDTLTQINVSDSLLKCADLVLLPLARPSTAVCNVQSGLAYHSGLYQ